MCLDLMMSLISHHHQFYKQATNLHPAFVNCLCSEFDFLVPLLYIPVNTKYVVQIWFSTEQMKKKLLFMIDL